MRGVAMRYRVLSVALVLLMALSLMVSAQTRNPSAGPRGSEPVPTPARPMTRTVTPAVATTRASYEGSFPHPDEIQAKLKLLADQLAEAGLPDEARALAIFEQRLRTQHYPKLVAAYQKSVQNQISLKVQIVEVTSAADVSQLFPKASKEIPPTGRTLSGVLALEKIDQWIQRWRGRDRRNFVRDKRSPF
jgi:hypothetical protein